MPVPASLLSRRALYPLLALAWLAACGGEPGSDEDQVVETDTDDTDVESDDTEVDTDGTPLDPALEALLASATPWGPADAALPPGGVLVPPEELLELTDTLALRSLDPEAQQEALDAVAARQAADRALIQAYLADHPELAERYPLSITPTGEVLPDGSVVITPRGSAESVALDPYEDLLGSLAASIRAASDPVNLRALHADLYQMLPGDRVGGLATPASLAAESDVAVLEAAIEAVTGRVTEVDPHGTTPTDARAVQEATGNSTSDLVCGSVWGTRTPWEEAALMDMWPTTLRAFLPATRSQGRRGSCVAFATTGAVEIATWASFGRKVDLSEQDLYGVMKGDWDPEDGDFGDGTNLGFALGDMASLGYDLVPEPVWPYNPSWDRVPLPNGTYFQSCLNYDSTCTETNHQRGTACSVIEGQTFCFVATPRADLDGPVTTARVSGYASVWNAGKSNLSLDAIAATVRAGHPVVIAAEVDDALKDVGEDQLIPEPYGEVEGSHAMVVVGHISMWEYISLAPQIAEAPGSVEAYKWLDYYALPPQDLFLIRNSWGCGYGDRGHVWVTRDWMLENVFGAWKVVALAPNLPSVSLSANASQVSSPQTVRFTVAPKGPVAEVELFSAFDSVAVDASPPFVFDIPITSDHNGLKGWFVVGRDAVGTAVNSNVVMMNVSLPDASAPSVDLVTNSSVIAPTDLIVAATASDPDGVARVELWRRGGGGFGFTQLGVDEASPWAFGVSLHRALEGELELFAVAYDELGNMGVSTIAEVAVTVDRDPPEITPIAPVEVEAPGQFTLLANVTDPSGVAEVEFLLGSASLGVRTSPPWAVSVDVDISQAGRAQIYTVRATDGQGNTGTAFKSVPVVLGGPPAEIGSFTASRTTLSALGGLVTLDWDVTPGSTLTLSDVGDVSGQTGWVLSLPPNLTAAPITLDVDLTAETIWGTDTASLTLTVDPLPVGWLVVDPTTGDDTLGTGTLAAPYRTTYAAVPRLAPNGGLLLASGNHPTLGPLDLPAGTTVRAAEPGGAILVPWIVNQSSGWLRPQGSASFEGFVCSVGGPCIETAAGAVTVTDVQGRANTCGGGANSALVVAAGTAQVQLIATSPEHDWLQGPGAACLGRVDSGTARLEILGGRVVDVPSTGGSGESILTHNAGALVVDGVSFARNAPGILRQWGGTAWLHDVHVDGTTTGTNGALFSAFGPSMLELEDSLVEGGAPKTCVLVAGGTPTVTLRGTVLDGCEIGISSSFIFNAITPNLFLEDSEIVYSTSSGINVSGGRLELLRSRVQFNEQVGVYAGGVTTLRMRESWVRGNRNEGITLSAADPITWDLGRGDDPGLNVLAGNGLQNNEASVSVLSMPGGSFLYASGNTWNVGEQGADGAGLYELPQGETEIDVSAATSAGTNYRKPAAGTIRLAEAACVPTGTCPP